MGPEKWKGEAPVDEAAERERERGGGEEAGGAEREATDPREEEGWSQPESSAQKEAERDASEG